MVFALLLEAAVQVPAVHVDALHLLAVQRGDDLDRPVRGGVRRADADDDRVVALAPLERRTDGIGQAGPDGSVQGRPRHVRYGTSGCSCIFP